MSRNLPTNDQWEAYDSGRVAANLKREAEAKAREYKATQDKMTRNEHAWRTKETINGYTLHELDKAFQIVADPIDWKAPIDAYIHPSLTEIVRLAIEFHTATKPVFTSVDPETGRVHVMAEGYRNGPAGDH